MKIVIDRGADVTGVVCLYESGIWIAVIGGAMRQGVGCDGGMGGS
jgi:hypothetical protein